jgi:uncharacterized membrane protein
MTDSWPHAPYMIGFWICLGLVLIGIGLAYQRLLFARPRAEEPVPDPDPTAS